MITKAIVEEIVDEYNIKVRIPFYNKVASAPQATPTENLYVATICTIPNSKMNYQIGDIVFIGFEDHTISKPVILGQLSRFTTTDNYPVINCESIKSNVDAILPYNTYIGEVSPTELQQLKGVNKNLQFQLDILSQRIAKLEEQLINK